MTDIEEVTEIHSVHGNVDILVKIVLTRDLMSSDAEVVINGGMEDLYRLTTEIIPKVGNVAKSETFVIVKSKRKWICLPEGFQDW